MKSKAIIVPFLCMGIGAGWLLSALGFMPGVNWAWIMGLGVLGLSIPLISGFDKLTVVASPFLMISSLCSLLRQVGWIATSVEVPSLVMAFGFCMLLPFFLRVPNPSWYQNSPEAN